MPPQISVVVPSYNPPQDHLAALYASLLAQTQADFECILVDDGSTDRSAYALVQDPRVRVVYRAENAGPAVCRNAGAALAESRLLFFTDTDCTLHPECLRHAVALLAHEDIGVGDTITNARTAFGRAVALLGFPGGGLLGFHRVWRVDVDGYTRSFSSCNLAFRKEAFEQLGRFNETFPVAGGEDTVLARHAVETGRRIRYDQAMIVYHVERNSLRSFLRWQHTRGRGNHYIQQNVPEVGGYLRLRLWTFANSFRAARWHEWPLVFILLVLSVLLQLKGMRDERHRARSLRP